MWKLAYVLGRGLYPSPSLLWSARTVGASHESPGAVSAVIIIACWMSWLHRMRMSSIHLRSLSVMVVFHHSKAGMVHSVSGWTRGVQVKLWDPLRTRAIPERLRGAFTTRRYTNPRLPSTIPNTNDFSSRSSDILQIWLNSWSFLCRMMSVTVHYRCTCRLTSVLEMWSCQLTYSMCL